ncbi:zona pellucida sperm-binding protein 3-like [Sardina pilchardus]|uniref:zona pellucida sperm-binding protein 3-like n=1 Tax=Sardina pilchardus TaxID=27697 RepID=UPI002E1223E4
MGLKLIAVGLVVLNALVSLSEAQYTQNTQNTQKPRPPPPGGKTNQEQTKPTIPMRPMTWKFPDVTVPSEEGVTVDLRTPIIPDSIKIECEEKQVLVEVDMDFYKTGQMINPSDITLGGCGVAAQDPSANKLLLQSDLHSCGSVLTTTSDQLIYTFTIIYAPQPFPSTNIVRTTGAVVGVECHYQRHHNVSSDILIPAWMPYSAMLSNEEIFLFSLKLMTDNFVSIRSTTEFYLGEMIYIEASVMQFYHVPLRVYVESCVARADVADMAPTYNVIDNYGCMSDAKVTGSSSRFMQRTADDKLQFGIEAFRFNNYGRIVITCRLKATAATTPRDSQHKACNYIGGGWASAGGSNEVCSCCDSNCADGSGGGKGTQNKNTQGELWGETEIGPITVTKKMY